MGKKRLIVFILFIILTQLLIQTPKLYAEDSQKNYEYNSDIDFVKNYDYKFLEYSFLSGEKNLNFPNFMRRSAFINQNGNQNESNISQLGNFGAIVDIIQIGNNNRAEVKQFSNFTKAEVFQFGNNHDLSIEQWGSEGKIYIIQSGNNLEDKEIKIVQF